MNGSNTFFGRIKRGLMGAVVGALVGAVLGGVLGALRPSSYSSSATGLVMVTGDGGDLGAANSGQELAVAKSQTYAALGQSTKVAEAVKKALASDEPAGSLLGKVQVTSGALVPTVTVTATANTPEEARDLAGEWLEAMQMSAADLDPMRSKSLVKLQPISPADLPQSANQPTGAVLIVLLTLLGAVSGLGLALLLQRREPRLVPRNAAVETPDARK